MSIRINAVHIENVLGITQLDFQPATITTLYGGNGTGKTSVLSALAAIFAGGHDPTLLRVGAESGLIRVELSDGASIEKQILISETQLVVRDQTGAIVSSPREYVTALGTSVSVDPSRLLSIDTSTATGRNRLIDEILKSVPITFAPDEIASTGAERPPSSLDLRGIEQLITGHRETRRQIGSNVHNAEGTLVQMQRELLTISESDDHVDWLDRGRALSAQLTSELEALHRDRMTVEHDAEADIAEVREWRDQQIRAIEEQAQQRLQEIIARRDSALRDLSADFDRRTRGIYTAISEAHSRATEQIRRQEAMRIVDEMRERVRASSLAYDEHSGIIRRLEDLRKSKISQIPVSGLDISDGEVTIDGVPWHRVNTATRARVALMISSLRAGSLPFLLLDDAEHLDAGSWQAVRDAAREAGFQLVAARVDDSPALNIQTEA